MREVRELTAVALTLVSASCVYGIKSLPTRSPPEGAGLPTDAGAESARRTSRRLWSFAGSAVELGLGSLTYTLASHTSRKRDSLILEGAGEALFVLGAGDLALATIDSVLATPSVNASGDFERPDRFIDRAPSTRWPADAGGAVSVASQRRVEAHTDVATFHWLTPTLRMRYQLGVDHGVDFAGSATESYYGLGGGASIEWSPSRRHYGRHPHSALIASLLPRVVFGSEREFAGGYRATVGWELGPIAVGVGMAQTSAMIGGPASRPGSEFAPSRRTEPSGNKNGCRSSRLGGGD